MTLNKYYLNNINKFLYLKALCLGRDERWQHICCNIFYNSNLNLSFISEGQINLSPIVLSALSEEHISLNSTLVFYSLRQLEFLELHAQTPVNMFYSVRQSLLCLPHPWSRNYNIFFSSQGQVEFWWGAHYLDPHHTIFLFLRDR